MTTLDVLALHQTLARTDASYAVAICDARILEGLKWEFKRRDKRSDGQVSLTREERKDLAKIISGFANSDGGVFVWGIDTDKSDGIDRAKCVAPIDRVAEVLTGIEAALATLVTPPVLGVECCAWPQVDGQGYIVVRVPRSDRRPHMAIAAGENKYYFRDQEGFKPMLHFQVEDAFARRRKPSFEATVFMGGSWRSTSTHSDSRGTHMLGGERLIAIAVKNTSDVTAEQLSVELEFDSEVRFYLVQPGPGFRNSHGSETRICYHSDGSVHLNPDFECMISLVTIRAHRKLPSDDFAVSFLASDNRPVSNVKMRISAKDTRPIETDLVLDFGPLSSELPAPEPEPTTRV